MLSSWISCVRPATTIGASISQSEFCVNFGTYFLDLFLIWQVGSLVLARFLIARIQARWCEFASRHPLHPNFNVGLPSLDGGGDSQNMVYSSRSETLPICYNVSAWLIFVRFAFRYPNDAMFDLKIAAPPPVTPLIQCWRRVVFFFGSPLPLITTLNWGVWGGVRRGFRKVCRVCKTEINRKGNVVSGQNSSHPMVVDGAIWAPI